ncbi:MAG: DinB family protein [Ktedonobacteraceae bacterium]|nr:DinB family protein [Ktedonobacteraceae bacterium]
MNALKNPFEKVRPKMVAARIEFIGQLAKFSKQALAQEPTGTEWSPLQLAHHLYITDGMALEQMRRVQDEDNPLIPDLGELSPRLTRASESPVSLNAVLAGMAARREEIFEYLSTLPVEAWERPFRSERWGGQRKFYQLVNVLPMHDKQHAEQLTTLKMIVEE